MNRILLLFGFLAISQEIMSQSFNQFSRINQNVDSLITQTIKENKIPGLSLAVVKDGELVFSNGYGFINLEHSIPTTETSIFSIASITKSFTALAVMILVESGKITLDKSIDTYLSDLPDSWEGITIRQLLNHTSGISSFTSHEKIPCPVGKDLRNYVRGDAIKEVACLPLDFNPGEDWAYGDTGYYLLGMLIEKITNLKYEVFLQESILIPLGMEHTRLISYEDIIPNRADGYSYSDYSFHLAPRFEVDEFSNGGLVSNATDMAKLHLAFTSEILLKKQSQDQMWTNTKLNNGKIIPSYGLGFGLTPFQGRKRIGHNGGGGLGFATALAHFPEEGITIIVLANSDQPQGKIGTVANQVASYYFK